MTQNWSFVCSCAHEWLCVCMYVYFSFSGLLIFQGLDSGSILDFKWRRPELTLITCSRIIRVLGVSFFFHFFTALSQIQRNMFWYILSFIYFSEGIGSDSQYCELILSTLEAGLLYDLQKFPHPPPPHFNVYTDLLSFLNLKMKCNFFFLFSSFFPCTWKKNILWTLLFGTYCFDLSCYFNKYCFCQMS